MPQHALVGHLELKDRLATAMRAGTLPPAMLLVGPRGVGKQRLGLWLAQGMVCEQGPGAPCDQCHACRLALSLGHPDIHWFFPIARPKGDETKQVEEAEDSLNKEIAQRRENAVYERPDGMSALHLPLVRVLHRRAQMRPAMARAKVFIIGDAERLVPQIGSEQAANAMLKVLEEPPPDTSFVLTTAEPAGLLPTIKSRLVQVRVGRLKPAEVTKFLAEVLKLDPAEVQRRATTAAGSIGDAIDAGGSTEGRAAGEALLTAARKGAVARHRYAFGVRSTGARGDFTATLDAAAELLRDDLARQLRDAGAGGDTAPASRLAAQLKEIEKARRTAQNNVNPQLIVADLLRRLAETGS